MFERRRVARHNGGESDSERLYRIGEYGQYVAGSPGGGKSHLSSAIGLALLEKGWRVLFSRTSDLVQKLQVARRELALESAIARLERFDLLILDSC